MTIRFHYLLDILGEVFLYQEDLFQLLGVGYDDFIQLDDVGMAKIFEEDHFSKYPQSFGLLCQRINYPLDCHLLSPLDVRSSSNN